MPVATEPVTLAHPLPGGRRGATVRLHPLLGGEIRVPGDFFDSRRGRFAKARSFLSRRSGWVWVPVPAFLVEHPSVGPLLVDTGMHPSVAVDPRANLSRVDTLMFSYRSIDGGVPERLRERGLEPTDVRVVLMTHLHADHASGIVEFPQATFVVDRREWEAASGPRPSLQGYHPPHFDHAFDWRAVDWDADWVQSLSPFGMTVDLFGDGSIRLVSTPGHSLGHQSVLVRLRDRDALICGDAVGLHAALDGEADPLLWADEHLYRRSLREIRRFAEREPEALVVPGHDAEVWSGLATVYE